MCMMAAGCTGESNGNTAVALAAPKRVIAAVDPEQLSVELRVNNQSYTAIRQADNSYVTSVTVPANRDSRITVVWTELFQGTRLKLAEQVEVVTVGDSAMTINFGDAYTTTGNGFDIDADGFSNLAERIEGTNPLSANDRPDAASLQLTVALPDDIVALGDDITLSATVNDAPVSLLRASAGVATASVPGFAAGVQASASVQINGSGLSLATAQKSLTLQLGDDNQLTIAQTDFDTSADTDNDGISNIVELLLGTNPQAAIDYNIARVQNAPQVDGSLSDSVWLNRLTQSNSLKLNRLITADSGENQVTTDGLLSAWAAVTDGETLFIALRIIDNSIQFDSGDMWWRDDAIELFIDGDNSKQPDNYDGLNDYHIGVRVEDLLLIRGGRSVGLPPNLVYELSAGAFDDDIANGAYASDLDANGAPDVGFNLEMAIPLEELGIDSDEPFGINVHYNDDDNGGDRDAKYSWVGRRGVDIDYLEPSSLATALISD